MIDFWQIGAIIGRWSLSGLTELLVCGVHHQLWGLTRRRHCGPCCHSPKGFYSKKYWASCFKLGPYKCKLIDWRNSLFIYLSLLFLNFPFGSLLVFYILKISHQVCEGILFSVLFFGESNELTLRECFQCCHDNAYYCASSLFLPCAPGIFPNTVLQSCSWRYCLKTAHLKKCPLPAGHSHSK